jgi:hypothetical protein
MKTWGVTSRRPHLCQRSDCEGVTAVRALPQRGEGAAAGGRRAGDCGCRAPSLGDAVLGVAVVARPRGAAVSHVRVCCRGHAVMRPPRKCRAGAAATTCPYEGNRAPRRRRTRRVASAKP